MLGTVFARADVKLETCNFLGPGVAIVMALVRTGKAKDGTPQDALRYKGQGIACN